jgi:signal transduction histidine kinase
MSTDASHPLCDRLRAAARIGIALGDPTTLDNLAVRLCRLSRALLGADATMLYLDADHPRVVASEGFTLDPPEALLKGFAPADLERLTKWASRSGYRRVELAPVPLDHHVAGLLAIFSASPGVTLEAADLQTLGAGIGVAIRQLRATDELRRAYEQREREQDQVVRAERMRALGAMALGIAHDFNNVLNAILAQAGVLGELAGPHPELQAALGKLRHTAIEGAGTVEKVNEFSRQRRDQEFSTVDLGPLVEAAARKVRQEAPNLRIVAALEPGAECAGNTTELGEVVLALVDNAVEAMASASAGTLTLELKVGAEELVLLVGDTGQGMSRDVRRRAFDPFFTTKGSRVKGLGLSLAFGIVRRHGGRIELDSAPGKGTRVKLRLPRLVAPIVSEVVPAPSATRRPSSGPVRVLLVEDDPDNRDAMATLLELSGYQVTAAESGSAGVRAFGDAVFDVVLTDLGLPDMNGWQVAGSIKSSAPAVPVALITGWGFNLDGDEIRRRGVDLLVKKPIDPRRFLSQLEALVG